jgi:hypothetical protein
MRLTVGTRYWRAFGSWGSRSFDRESCTMVVMSGPLTSGYIRVRPWIVGYGSDVSAYLNMVDIPSHVFEGYCLRRSVFRSPVLGRRRLTISAKVSGNTMRDIRFAPVWTAMWVLSELGRLNRLSQTGLGISADQTSTVRHTRHVAFSSFRDYQPSHH